MTPLDILMLPVFLFIGTVVFYFYMKPTLFMWRGLVKSGKKLKRSFTD